MTLPTDSEVLARVAPALARHGRVALCQLLRTEGSTPGKTGWKLLVEPGGRATGNLGGGAFEALVKRDAADKLAQTAPRPEIRRYYLTEEATRGEATGMVCGGMAEVLLEVLSAKPLLVAYGGGPVAQALASNAVLCGFEVLIVEDREAFRDPALFPEGTRFAAVRRDDAGGLLAAESARDLYVAVVSRCWETDLAAMEAIAREAPAALCYLGLMGSERKVRRILDELAGRGLRLPAELQAPIGLPIGAETPGELAVSILAEMIARRRATRPETIAGAERAPSARDELTTVTESDR
jgi:xanthine dehydrogenase accessory factor